MPKTDPTFFKTDQFSVLTFFFFGHIYIYIYFLVITFFLSCKSVSVPTTTKYDVCMFANCFVVFRTKGNNAVCSAEG